ncbi:MAG: hypothetical protein GXC76_12080 [Rhodanobacteraceae bacterium]|jgi:hypothetical protein|nr:hypothetical protein [Rhodanobacteraceae bacterium]
MFRDPSLPRSFPTLRSLCAVGALTLATGNGHAAVWCVASAQELYDALEAAAASTDASNTIRIREGEYQQAPFQNYALRALHSNQSTEVSGGWSGPTGQCTVQKPIPARTRVVGMDGITAFGVFTGALGSPVTNASVYVHDLTLSNAHFDTTMSLGACLASAVSTGNTAIFERIRIEQCIARGGTDVAASINNDGGQLIMRNVVVRNNVSYQNGGISISTTSGGSTRLSQISITNVRSLRTDADVSGIDLSGSTNSSVLLANSVVWGNEPNPAIPDILLRTDNISLNRVHFGKLAGTPGSNLSPGSGDPRFVAPGDPHLRANSPLVDSGAANPIGGGNGMYDVDGSPRTQGAAVDVGAFERDPDAIFINGFD